MSNLNLLKQAPPWCERDSHSTVIHTKESVSVWRACSSRSSSVEHVAKGPDDDGRPLGLDLNGWENAQAHEQAAGSLAPSCSPDGWYRSTAFSRGMEATKKLPPWKTPSQGTRRLNQNSPMDQKGTGRSGREATGQTWRTIKGRHNPSADWLAS